METATTIQAKTVYKLERELWKWKDKVYTKDAGTSNLHKIPIAFKKVLPKKYSTNKAPIRKQRKSCYPKSVIKVCMKAISKDTISN